MPPVPMPFKVAAYTPDLPDLDNPGSPNARNVLPRTNNSFGPVAAPMVYADSALEERCQGAAAFLDPTGNAFQFAGDVNDLYQFDGMDWNVVSQTPGGYTTPDTGGWRFEYFNGLTIATNYGDAIQKWELGTSTAFADLANGGVTALQVTAGSGYADGVDYALGATGGGGGSGFAGLVDVVGGALANARVTTPGSGFTSPPTITFSAGAGTSGSIAATVASIAPKARYMAYVRGFLMLAGTNDGTSGEQPQRVWWSGAGNPENWPTPGTAAAAQALSSYNDLTGSNGWNQGIVGGLGSADAVIFQEHAVYRVVFSGPPNVFDFIPAQGVKGCPAPGSIAQVGGIVFYLGEDGFYAFDGASSKPIGVDQVDKTFYADLDQAHLDRICSTVDPINKIVFWAYPGSGNSGGNPNRILAHRWDLQRWAILDITCEMMARLLTVGYTLDELYTVLGYSFDGPPAAAEPALPAPLDSRLWTGGQVLLGLFDTSHKLNVLSGAAMAATIDSGERLLFGGNKRGFVTRAVPWVEGQSVTPAVAIGYRNRQVDQVTFTPASPLNAYGICPQRITGRYIRTRLTIPAGSEWRNAIGSQIEAEPRGER